MPTLHGIRERFDKIIFDTHEMKPGQTIRFMDEECTIQKGGPHFTTMRRRGAFFDDQTYIICGLALRILDHTQVEEEPLLDHFMLTPTIGHKMYGPYPGNVCSTFRTIYDRDLGEEKSLEKAAFSTLPGYVLLRSLIIPVRMSFYLEVSASPNLPKTVIARASFFGLFTRDVA